MILWFWKIDKNVLKIFEKYVLSSIQSVFLQQIVKSDRLIANQTHTISSNIQCVRTWTVMNQRKNNEFQRHIKTSITRLHKFIMTWICLRSIKTIFIVYNNILLLWNDIYLTINFEIHIMWYKVLWKVDALCRTWKRLCQQYRLVFRSCLCNRSCRPNNAFCIHLLDSGSEHNRWHRYCHLRWRWSGQSYCWKRVIGIMYSE